MVAILDKGLNLKKRNYLDWGFPYTNLFTENSVIYEFGVYSGHSLAYLLYTCELANRPIKKVFGIDSFEGLPEEKNNKIYNPDCWYKGAFDATKIFKHEPQKVLQRYFNMRFPQYNVKIIKKWFNELSIDEDYGFEPAAMIHIDCDIYTSTVDILEFMWRGSYLQTGTIINYNDLNFTSNNHNTFDYGEGLAHNEFSNKYHLKWRELNRHIFQLQ